MTEQLPRHGRLLACRPAGGHITRRRAPLRPEAIRHGARVTRGPRCGRWECTIGRRAASDRSLRQGSPDGWPSSPARRPIRASAGHAPCAWPGRAPRSWSTAATRTGSRATEAAFRAEGLAVVGVAGSMDTEAGGDGPAHRPGIEAFGRIDLLVSTVGGAPHPLSFDAIPKSSSSRRSASTRGRPSRSSVPPWRGARRRRRLGRHHFERLTAQDHLGHGLVRGGQGSAQRHDAHHGGRPGRAGRPHERGQPGSGPHDRDRPIWKDDDGAAPARRSPWAGSPKPTTSPARSASSFRTTHARSPASPSTSTAGTTSPAAGRRSGSRRRARSLRPSLHEGGRPPRCRCCSICSRTWSGAMPGSCTRRLSASAPVSSMAPRASRARGRPGRRRRPSGRRRRRSRRRRSSRRRPAGPPPAGTARDPATPGG